jgi:hypothetical protein
MDDLKISFEWNGNSYAFFDPEKLRGIVPDQIIDAAVHATIISTLWQSCTDYQAVRLDGNGVGAMIGKIMQATLGGTPHTKAEANIGWWQGLWADYEARRAAVLEGETVDMDFSTHGDIPYRVAEAMAE